MFFVERIIMGMNITGVDRTIAKLQAVCEDKFKAAEQAILSGALKIQQTAIENAPVDEGNLENSIKVEIERQS